jgi:N-acetylglutamate synthase/N-acetylornithine aminotransferase
MQDLQWLEGGITAVPGVLASGLAAGIKPSGKKDLALIYSSSPARAAAVFTKNQVKGAPGARLAGARAGWARPGHRRLERMLERLHG